MTLAAACSREQATATKERVQQTAHNAKEKVAGAFDASTPTAGKDDPAAREKERFDERWRQLQSFQQQQAQQQAAQQAQQQAQQQAAAVKMKFAPNAKESWKGVAPEAIDAAPVAIPVKGDVAGPSVLKAQVYLDRADFSVGVLDGRWGKNSAIAVWWYQRTHGLPTTGAVDEATFRSLAQAAGGASVVTKHTLSADDVKGPFVTIPDDVYEKEKLDCLCYESLEEKLAERFHTTTDFLAQLNAGVDLSSVKEGTQIWVPNVREAMSADRADVAKIVVSIAGNTFNAYDASGNLVFHAPTTLGSKFDPSPNEATSILKVVQDPHFHYQPTLFHEVPDTDPEAELKPGPNSPVGVVWIALKKPHFGIHGTSDPDSIGYASSHGCVRLTNWDAREISHRVREGITVEFVDTRKKS